MNKKIVTKSLARMLVCFLSTGALGACGGADGGGSTLDVSVANGVSAATLAACQQAAMGAMGAGANGLTVANGMVSGTLTNPNGGTATVTGTQTTAGTTVTNSLTLVFANWVDKADNITFNGTLTDAASNTGTDYSFALSGNLNLTGAVTNTATFKLTYSQTGTCQSETGTLGGVMISAKVGC